MNGEITQSVPSEALEAKLEVRSDTRESCLSRNGESDDTCQQQIESRSAAGASDDNLQPGSVTASGVPAPYLVSMQPDRPTPIPKIVEALRAVPLLSGLTDEEFTWLASHGVELVVAGNALAFRQGQPLLHMCFILRGELHVRRRRAGRTTTFIRHAGQAAGLMPFSRTREFGGDGTAVGPFWGLDIHKDQFSEMLAAIPSMGQRCINALLDRVREDTRTEQQSESFNAFTNRAEYPGAEFPTAGDVLSGRFQIIRRLGDGGMGHVYQARDLEAGVEVALKIIRPEISQNPEVLARFRREVRIAHRIMHPNVCRTYNLHRETRQIGSDPSGSFDFLFLTMEYLDGETLQQLLKRRGRLEPTQAILIASQIAKGLNAAHQAGIVHRDLKPSNVMITHECSGSARVDRAVLTDFGLARFETATESNDSSTISRPGGFIGTLMYMAPEQLQGNAVTAATDIYSFGLVLYEIVTGDKVFPDSSSMAAAFRRITQPSPFPRELVTGLSPEWETAIQGCLEIDPTSRFQSATDVIAALEGR